MDNSNQSLSRVKADLSNYILLTLNLIATVLALSVGLAFYLLVGTKAAMTVGIIMFIVAGFMLACGLLLYMAKMAKIKQLSE
ncbi:MAG: hypothetical protein WCR54_00965 [Clostridia bacterium]